MFRPELKQPKNAAGAILVTAALLLFFAAFIRNGNSDAPFIIAAAMYIIGMILIVIPGRAADPGHDHNEGHDNE